MGKLGTEIRRGKERQWLAIGRQREIQTTCERANEKEAQEEGDKRSE